jgi:hypothetical protein
MSSSTDGKENFTVEFLGGPLDGHKELVSPDLVRAKTEITKKSPSFTEDKEIFDSGRIAVYKFSHASEGKFYYRFADWANGKKTKKKKL